MSKPKFEYSNFPDFKLSEAKSWTEFSNCDIIVREEELQRFILDEIGESELSKFIIFDGKFWTFPDMIVLTEVHKDIKFKKLYTATFEQ